MGGQRQAAEAALARLLLRQACIARMPETEAVCS
jgi:hypothetical protein